MPYQRYSPYGRAGYRGYRGGYRGGRVYARPPSSWSKTTLGDVAKTAATALAVATAVKSMVNVEYKEDNDSITTSPDSSGYVDLIFNTAQGDSESTRDGQSCRIKSLRLLGHIKLHASATDTQVRFIVFTRHVVNGTLPAVTDVLRIADVQALPNTDNRGDIKILLDKTWCLSTASAPRVVVDWYRKMNLEVLYTRGTTTGGIASLEHNGLFVCVVSSESTNTPAVNIATRCRYIDN